MIKEIKCSAIRERFPVMLRKRDCSPQNAFYRGSAEACKKPHICPSDEMVDLSDSKSDASRRAGSSPALGTTGDCPAKKTE